MDNQQLKKLLVPIDYSETSLNALDSAVAISQRHGADIRLLHVIDPSQYIFTWDENELIGHSKKALLDTQQQKLQQLAQTISNTHAVSCSAECRAGVICDMIVEAAYEFNPDFIVMGTHGTSGIREYFMGSEAYRVVKTASCPVLTVPNNRKWTRFNEIVFPVRPVLGALDKYETARKLIRKSNAHLTVLALLDQDDEQAIELLNTAITSLNNRLVQDGIAGDTLLLETNSVAKTVLKKSDELSADLIIITTELDTTIHDFFMGPFAQQVINHAQVPVLSIRPQPVITLRMQPINTFVQSVVEPLNRLFPRLSPS